MASDDVQLPDLEVIRAFSLAVRGATAPREQVVAALEADLAWLKAGSRRVSVPTAPAPTPTPTPAPAGPRRPRRAAVPPAAEA